MVTSLVNVYSHLWMQYTDTSALRSFCGKMLQYLLLFQSAVRQGPHIFIQNIVINISFLPNVFNPQASELNPICKSQVPDLFCGVFKFSACFSKNLNISRTERDKFVKQKAVCGEWIRHCSECLKNAAISLLRNVEDTFLKKTCKYTCSFTYIVVQASTLCMEDGRKNVL